MSVEVAACPTLRAANLETLLSADPQERGAIDMTEFGTFDITLLVWDFRPKCELRQGLRAPQTHGT